MRQSSGVQLRNVILTVPYFLSAALVVPFQSQESLNAGKCLFGHPPLSPLPQILKELLFSFFLKIIHALSYLHVRFTKNNNNNNNNNKNELTK